MPIPIFLERRSYRMRRMMDAVRFLPTLGVALWIVPLLWPRARAETDLEGISMSAALWYIFAVWIALILATFVLWRFTRTVTSQDSMD